MTMEKSANLYLNDRITWKKDHLQIKESNISQTLNLSTDANSRKDTIKIFFGGGLKKMRASEILSRVQKNGSKYFFLLIVSSLFLCPKKIRGDAGRWGSRAGGGWVAYSSYSFIIHTRLAPIRVFQSRVVPKTRKKLKTRKIYKTNKK